MDSPNAEKRIPLNGGAGILSAANGVISVSWENFSGKRQATLPDSLKKSDPVGVERVKKIATDVRADLVTWKGQIERYYLEPVEWSYGEWRQRYADHGTLSLLARRIIWTADDLISFLPIGDGCIGSDGARVEISSSAKIRLWHPIQASASEVSAWRQRLMDRGVIQPFRQAWREVYLLTDAERQTATYSNRFAGQILRQHQMRALAISNGWHSKHRVGFDGADEDPSFLAIPHFGLQAEYWNSGLSEGQMLSGGGAYVYVKTDRVKFHTYNAKAKFKRGAEVQISAIPRIVFSEVMRHCDLFTSVAAVALDPEWMDRGANAAHPSHYNTLYRSWQDRQDQPLPPSAEVRREMLRVLIGGMSNADRLSITDKHVHVVGKLHSYSIHIGSAAVHMDGKHICIIPINTLTRPKMYLPFECDTTLSTILSKVMLLLNDDKIVDPVILGQINR
jgi:hypothetical protein